MSDDSIRAFLEKAEEDSELQSSLQATRGEKSAICLLAASFGFLFSEDDLEVFVKSLSSELDEDDLENITGGGSRQMNPSVLWLALRARNVGGHGK